MINLNLFYTVKVARTVEETHRVRAGSIDDACENWDTDGELIERDDEHGETTALMAVQPEGGVNQKAYSVLLAYPQPNGNGEPETYYAHVLAVNTTQAVQGARLMATNANDTIIPPEDFYPLLVLAGHIEAEAFGREVT